VLSLQKTHII